MKTSRIGLIVIMLAMIGSLQIAFGADDIYVRQPTTYEGPDFVPGQIIVQFRRGVPEDVIAQINEKNKAKVAYTSRFARFKVLSFPEAVPPQAMAKIYAKNPNVEYAELNHVRYAFGVPNDPYYSYQWHLKGIGMEQAWDISPGSDSVIVAVVDTGISIGSDLAGTSFAAGYDFVNNDDYPTDDHGHGTHVAGTIAQSTNNSLGVAGVAYGCTLMPVKVLDSNGSGYDSTVAEGIYWAADHGADVINMSLGGPSESPTLQNAVAYAHNAGVTIVCASGNDAGPVGYPAAYSQCIAVGATRYDEAVAYYSNGGSELDLTAPGGDVTVDQNSDGYGDGVLQQTFSGSTWGYYFYQGTSMASPHVAGVAALLISQGTYTTPSAILSRLQSTAKDKGPAGWDSSYGSGIVDAAAALGGEAPPAPVTLSSIDVTPASATVAIGGTEQYTAMGNYSDGSTKPITASVTWRSSKTRIASIDSSGLATGIRKGTVYITATLDGVTSNQATLTVSRTAPTPPPTLESIDVTPASATVAIGGTRQYTATGTYSDGSTQNVTSSATWSSSDTYVATVSSGLATGENVGTASITATLDGLSDTASLTVTSSSGGEGLRVAFTNDWTDVRTAGRNTFVTASAEVEVVDGDNNPVEGATVTCEWSLASSGVTTGVTDGTGLTVLTSPEAKAPRNGDGLMFRLTIINVEKSGSTYDPATPDIWDVFWP